MKAIVHFVAGATMKLQGVEAERIQRFIREGQQGWVFIGTEKNRAAFNLANVAYVKFEEWSE